MSKAQWLNEFVGTFLLCSRHFMSERSIRLIALQQWETHRASNPADVAKRWDIAASSGR